MSDNTNLAEHRDRKGRFTVGNRGGPGRPPGVRRTQELVEALEAVALDKLGVAYFEELARIDPSTFCGLLGRLLPRPPSEVKVEGVAAVVANIDRDEVVALYGEAFKRKELTDGRGCDRQSN